MGVGELVVVFFYGFFFKFSFRFSFRYVYSWKGVDCCLEWEIYLKVFLMIV